jgi:hypothetical protein
VFLGFAVALNTIASEIRKMFSTYITAVSFEMNVAGTLA